MYSMKSMLAPILAMSMIGSANYNSGKSDREIYSEQIDPRKRIPNVPKPLSKKQKAKLKHK